MTTKKRQKIGLSATDVRIGQNINYKDGVWSVLAPHPETGKFWLHRWVGDTYETVEAKVSEMTSRVALTNQGQR